MVFAINTTVAIGLSIWPLLCPLPLVSGFFFYNHKGMLDFAKDLFCVEVVIQFLPFNPFMWDLRVLIYGMLKHACVLD